jgi:hypothetical protein
MNNASGNVMGNDDRILKNDNRVLLNGHLGYGLKFDGFDDFVAVPNIPAYQFAVNADMCLSVFFYPSTNPNTRPTLISSRQIGGGNKGYALFLVNNTTSYDMDFVFDDPDNTSRIQIRTTGSPIMLNRINHVLINKKNSSANANNIDMYVNGYLIDKTIISNTLVNNGNPWAASFDFGRDLGNSVLFNSYFKGYIFTASVFDRALTDDEIADLYINEGEIPATATSDYVALFPFDEKRNFNLIDESSSNNTGTLTGYSAGDVAYGIFNSWVDAYTLAPIER